jgi:predicted PurR-regulated permease PerM
MAEPDPSQRRFDLDRVVRIVIAAAVVVAILWLLRFLSDVLIPFAIAVLLAYLINPIVSALERKIRSRIAATLITVAGCLAVLVLLGLLLVPLIGGELAAFGRMIDQLRADAPPLPDAKTLKTRFDAYIRAQDNQVLKTILLKLRQTIAEGDYEAIGMQAAQRLAPGVWSLVTGVLSFVLGLTVLLLILLLLIFVSIDYAKLSGEWRTYLPPKHRDRISGFVDEFSLAMSQYFRGQFIIAVTVGVLFAFGFWLIGLRMGIVLGLAIGALNMVPYLQTVGLVPAVFLGIMRAIEHGTGLAGSVLLVLLVFVVVQAIQEALLIPLVMGKQTGLRPVSLFLGVFIWGKLLGFLGLVLAIPLTCLAVAWYRRFVLGQRDAVAIEPPPSS